MGFLDNLKAKASEGLNFASEKLGDAADYLANLNDDNKQVIPTENAPTENAPATYSEANSTIYNPADYQVQQEISVVQSRTVFSVNENDSNETRQFKEMTQDANEIVQNVNQVVNGETMRNFSEAAKVIAVSYSMYKSREQEIERELEIIAQQNQHNLNAMKLAYQNVNPRIDELISEVKKLLNDLRAYEGKDLTDKELTQYNGLITLITKLSGQAMSLYEKIMG